MCVYVMISGNFAVVIKGLLGKQENSSLVSGTELSKMGSVLVPHGKEEEVIFLRRRKRNHG